MKKINFAICDEDEVYCARLSEYLQSHLSEVFSIVSFTEACALDKYFEKSEANLVLVSEKSYEELKGKGVLGDDRYRNIILLNEEPAFEGGEERGLLEGNRIVEIGKFLPAKRIVSAVLEFCADRADEFKGVGLRTKTGNSRVFGFYTPLSRCGQTTLAMKAGEVLSADKRTIFLSFESFSALGRIFAEEPLSDLSDLIYFHELDSDSFYLNFEIIRKTINGLDIIPPAKTSLQVREFDPKTISGLIKTLSETCGYENIILDLTEYPDGFLDILSACDRIYTITRNTPEDMYRMDRYKEILINNGYEDILSSTVSCNPPHLRNTAEYMEYVKELVLGSKEDHGIGA